MQEIYAYKAKCDNFAKLKKGLEQKFVSDELDLEDRQQKSILKLCDTPSDDYSLSSGYFHACTAFGKTYLMMAIAEGYRAEEPNKKIIILEESTKVLEQVKRDFTDKTSFSTTDIGAYYGKEKSPESPVITCTYSSMEKLVKEVGAENIGLVLCDEAHHILSENRRRVVQAFSGSCLYGFTATPEYNADKECASVFGAEIDKVSLSEGITEELLCGFKNGLMISKIPVDLTEAKSSSGDYDGEKLAEILKQSHIHGIREELAEYYLNGFDNTIGQIKGKPTIINAPNQAEADMLAEAFNHKAGTLIAKAYHTNSGELPLEEFNNGEFPVLIQVNRITEGYSNPKVEVCINYPTASRVRSAQRSGRALRRDKDNPDKVALVLDICFMKDNSSSPLEGVHANGQVLFMDIAGDAEMFSPEYRKRVQTVKQISSLKNNYGVTEFQLFDIITDYENLFEMRANEIDNNDKNAPKRDKLPTDLGQEDFKNFSIQQNGKTVDVKAKSDLYKKLLANQSLQEQGVFIKVKACSNICSVVPQDKLPALKAYLQAQGYEFVDRDKLLTDLDIVSFKSFSIRQNGETVDREARSDLYKELSVDQSLQKQGVFLKVKAGSKVCSVVPQNKLPALKAYLQKQGYEFIDREYDRDKLPTDLDMVGFKNFSIQQNGQTVNREAKSDLYKELSVDQSLQKQGVFLKVKAGAKVCSVVPADKLTVLKAYLQKRGYEFINRDKLPTDLDMVGFARFMIQQNGKTVDLKAKYDLYKELSANRSLQEQGVFLKVKTGSSVVPEDKLVALKAYLQERGYKFIDHEYDRDKLPTDLIQKDFISFSIRQNGETVGIEAKFDLYKELSDNPSLQEQGVFLKVKAGTIICSVIPEDKLTMLKAYLQKQGYEFVDRDKLQTDLGQEDFKNFSIQQNGQTVDTKAKSDLYKELSINPILQEQGVLIKVKAGKNVCSVVPEDKLPTLKAYLQKQGYKFVDREYDRDKLPTDLIQKDFISFIIQQNGQTVDTKAKSDLYKELSTNLILQEQGVFIKVKAGTNVCSVVPEDKLPALKAYLQEQGYEIQTPFDRYLAAEKEVATAQTKEEKKKHLEKMKKAFYLAHPEAKKKNLCSACWEKSTKADNSLSPYL